MIILIILWVSLSSQPGMKQANPRFRKILVQKRLPLLPRHQLHGIHVVLQREYTPIRLLEAYPRGMCPPGHQSPQHQGYAVSVNWLLAEATKAPYSTHRFSSI